MSTANIRSCICDRGYTGDTCDQKDCPVLLDCGPHGILIKKKAPANVEVMEIVSVDVKPVGVEVIVRKLNVFPVLHAVDMVIIYKYIGDCRERGKKRECSCHAGWGGERCEKQLCTTANKCNGRGIYHYN